MLSRILVHMTIFHQLGCKIASTDMLVLLLAAVTMCRGRQSESNPPSHLGRPDQEINVKESIPELRFRIPRQWHLGRNAFLFQLIRLALSLVRSNFFRTASQYLLRYQTLQ